MLQRLLLLRQITLRHAVPVGRSIRPTDREGRARRLVNVAVAAVGLVFALPLMLVIAALIKLTSRGPVLFKQTRIGWDRRGALPPRGDTPPPAELGRRPCS